MTTPLPRGALALLLTLVAADANAAALALDGIRFWVGQGPSRAALVIDWSDQDDAGPALAWGYRWSGVATGADLLRAVVEADPRLFAKLGGSSGAGLGLAVYGLGYDANGDAGFSLDDATEFDPQGVAASGPADFAASVDAADFYAEGWLVSGYWSYATRAAADAPWEASQVGAGQRTLVDGGWDALVFSPSFADFAPPANPVAAPAMGLAGDYNADGSIDAADYTLWRDTLGERPPVAGAGADDDHSWLVDEADYHAWRDHYGGAATGVATPEPRALAALLLALFFVRQRNQEKAS